MASFKHMFHFLSVLVFFFFIPSSLCAHPSVAIFTHSGSSLQAMRNDQRKICRPHYQYYGNITHYFAVGLPSFDDRDPSAHVQGQLATEKEIMISKQLLQEDEEFQDILITPNRDYYRDKTEKMMSWLREAVQMDVDYILKTDDDYCVNLTRTFELIEQHEQTYKGAELYLGYDIWNGNERNMMKGPHGETAPFASGWVYGLSRRLAVAIVQDWNRHLLKAAYGTSSDDANLGKMVAFVDKKYNMPVRRLSDADVYVPINKKADKYNILHLPKIKYWREKSILAPKPKDLIDNRKFCPCFDELMNDEELFWFRGTKKEKWRRKAPFLFVLSTFLL